METTPANGRQFSQTVSLRPEEQDLGDRTALSTDLAAEPSHDDRRRPSVAFTMSVDPPRRGACILSLAAGQFETCTMPENVEQLWGPIYLPSLPDGVPNTCIVASHKYDQYIRPEYSAFQSTLNSPIVSYRIVYV